MNKTISLITGIILLAQVLTPAQFYTLDQCIELALKKKETVKSAALDVKSAKYGNRGSYSNALPSLSASGNWSQRTYSDDTVPTVSSQGTNISVSQTLFDGGVMWNSIFRANNNYQINQEMQRQTRSQAIYNVTQSFYTVLKSQQLLDVARMNLMLANQQVELVTNQFEIGSVAKTDLLKVNVLKGQAQIQVIQRDAELSQAMRDLRNAMGLNDEDAPILLDDSNDDEIMLPDYKVANNMMELNNPVLLASRAQIKDAELNYKLVRSAHLPRLGLSWNYNSVPSGFGAALSAYDEYQLLSVGISIPLFTGFANNTRTQQAKIAISKQEYNYQTQTSNLNVQLNGLMELLTNYIEIIPINEEVLASAEEDLKLVQEQYALGSVTILEVLDAQLSVTQARSSLVSTKYDAQIQAAALKALLGTLDQEL